MIGRASRAQMGARRRAGAGGGVAPTITVAPVLTWTVAHGSSPTITEGTYTGDAGTWTYDLVRLPSTTVLTGVSKATVEAYVADRATDVGPDWKVTGTITNGSGSDSADSNVVTWDRSTLPIAGAHSGEGLTLADSGTTVDAYASSFGAFSCTRTAPTASQRPAYNPTGGVGGRPLLTFDGVNDMLVGTITKGSAWSSYEIGFVGERQSFTAANEGIVGYGSGGSSRFYLNDNNSTSYRFTIVGGANVTGGNPGTTAHYSGDAASGGTVNTRTGGTVINTTSTTVTSRSDGESWVIGSLTPAGANYSHYEFQADYIGELLTADQRADLRALLTYLTGVSS